MNNCRAFILTALLTVSFLAWTSYASAKNIPEKQQITLEASVGFFNKYIFRGYELRSCEKIDPVPPHVIPAEAGIFTCEATSRIYNGLRIVWTPVFTPGYRHVPPARD